MDILTIDNAYAQLRSEAQTTAQKIQALADALQAAAQAGDSNAKERLLDLREIALAVQTEEAQIATLLQAMHAFAVNSLQPVYAQQSGYAQQPLSGYSQPAPMGYAPSSYGAPNPIQGFLNSGFGRAVEMGLGFGLGDDVINKIFER